MKKLLIGLVLFLCTVSVFGQSYSEYLSKAKEYESKKQWCQALGSYYDALGTNDDPAKKIAIYNSYKELADTIASGNPGKGQFNAFKLHDEWKKLLIDAEKYGSSFPMYVVEIGKFEQGDLNYQNKTATYYADIRIKDVNDRYKKTIEIIATGYKKAYKSDWSSDLPAPKEWPKMSASSPKSNQYNVNGSLVFCYEDSYSTDNLYGNAFAAYFRIFPHSWKNVYAVNNEKTFFETEDANLMNVNMKTLFDYKFNVINENGKELIPAQRFLLGENRYRFFAEKEELRQGQMKFEGITPELMNLIDSGKAFLNPIAVYLEYGKFNPGDVKGTTNRSFMKNLPEVQLPLEKAVFIGPHCKGDIAAANFEKVEAFLKAEKVAKEKALADAKAKAEAEKIAKEKAEAEAKAKAEAEKVAREKTETEAKIAASVKEQIKAIRFVSIPGMGFEMMSTEVTQRLYETVMGENPSCYKGDNLPVECVSWYGVVDFCNKISSILGYSPVYIINGQKISQNEVADGFRLPTVAEWEYAAKGGKKNSYSGGDNPDKVAWFVLNSYHQTHPVAQKSPNGYGLYDMSGNVAEWCWDNDSSYYNNHATIGGSCMDDNVSISKNVKYVDAREQNPYIGFRIVRNVKSSDSSKATEPKPDSGAKQKSQKNKQDAKKALNFLKQL